MCWLFRRKKPNLDVSPISRRDYLAVLKGYGIEPISKSDPLDSTLNLATKDELDGIASDLVYPSEWYEDEIWDCEDYALQASLDAKRKYGVSVVLCIGLFSEGKHGFALALDKEGKVWVLEPNAGFPWAGVWHEPVRKKSEMSEGRYFPQKVFV